MKCLMLCFLAFSATVQCHPNHFANYLPPSIRIVGGREAQPHQFPYQVGLNLMLEDGNIYFCGGSLLTEWYILTAAHCTNRVKRIEVVLGAHNVNDPSEVTQIRMNTSIIIPHERWYPTMLLNDIAVVKLPRKVAFNKYVQPIRLPETETSDYAGENVIVSGWGKTKDNSNVMSNILRFVDNKVMSVKQCQDRYPTVIKETHLCISTQEGKSSCTGDSGGPLVIERNGTPFQIGIVSFGYPTCETNHPAIFTRVTKYLDWIQKNAEIKLFHNKKFEF